MGKFLGIFLTGVYVLGVPKVNLMGRGGSGGNCPLNKSVCWSGQAKLRKIHSSWSLDRRVDGLKTLKVEDMEATRPEDKAEILAAIPDKEAFDSDMQRMLFSDLLPSWKGSHLSVSLSLCLCIQLL